MTVTKETLMVKPKKSATIKLRYALVWMRFKIAMVFKPYISNTPASSTMTQFRVRRTKYGFVIWVPGIPGERFSRRIQLSWRQLFEEPVNFATYSYQRNPTDDQ